MGKVKELNIINQTYYFFDDMNNIRNFHSNLLKIDKKPYKDFDIYYIGYITIKKIDDYKNICSVNPLYLIIHSATGYVKEENDEKYLIIDLTGKYEDVFSGIRSEFQTINSGEELFYVEDYVKIGVNTDDNIPLNKKLKFPSLTIIIRCVFQNGKKLFPQVYLDKCLYEFKKMLEYDGIDISEGIDVDKSNNSKQCMLCHYWYYLDKNFSYGPHLCDGCYNIMQESINFKNIAIVHIKKSTYRIYFLYMSKREVKKLMTNSNLIDKKGVL